MIHKSNLVSLLDELDQILASKNASRAIVVYGGAALIALNILDRATTDIDIFQPEIDKLLKSAILEIGKKHKLGEFWMNSTGKAFVKELPAGWQKRVNLLYNGKSLTVSMLGRSDLIFTKILAELDRQEDLQDLLQLKPTQQELDSIEYHLLMLENSPEWKAKARDLLKLLRKLKR